MRPLKASKGFTLIELVVAITILGIIMTIAYSSLNGILRSKKTLEDKRDLQAVAYAILNRMTRELQLAYSGVSIMPPPNEKDIRYTSRTNLIGERGSLANGLRADKITFLALEGGQYLPDGGSHSGIVQISYRVEENPDAPQTSNAAYYLIRDETPYIRPYERAYERTMTFPITSSLVGLQFEYFKLDDETWHSVWDPEQHEKLPGMIKFSVVLRSPAGQEEEFTTTVPLRAVN